MDGGSSWRAANSGLGGQWIRSLVIDPYNPSALLASSSAGIFKSTDGGGNWKAVESPARPITDAALTIDSQYPPRSIRLVRVAFFKTVDGGETWKDLDLPPALTIAIDPLNAGTLFVATNGDGILKSIDGGIRWNAVNSGLKAPSVSAVAVDPQNSDIVYVGTANSGLFKTVNRGVVWSQVWPVKDYIQVIAIEAQAPSTIYVVAGGKMFKSKDAASTWEPVSVDPAVNHVSALSVDPQNPNTLYAGTNAGLFRSTDAAASWSLVNTELPLAGYRWYVSPYERNYNILYAVAASCGGLCNTRLFKSVDGGATWDEPRVSFRPYALAGTDTLTKLIIDPQNPDTVYAIVDHNNDDIDSYRSTDGGITWTALAYGVSDLTIDPDNANTIYAATLNYFTQNGVIKSTDGGTTWETINEGFPRLTFFTVLAIDPHDSRTIYAGSFSGLFMLTREAVPTN